MNIHLEPISIEGCQEARIWRNNCREALRTPFMVTEEMQVDFYNKIVRDRHSEDRYWEVIDEKGDYFGLGGLTDIEWENRLAEISLFINPAHHGQGYGKESVRLLCEEGFDHMNLKTIVGEAFLCNTNWGFWEKLTARFGGYKTILPNRKYWANKYWDSFYFSWDREDTWRGSVEV